MNQSIADVVCLEQFPLQSDDFRSECRRSFNRNGVLVMDAFLRPAAIESIRLEGETNRHRAYYTVTDHNIYLQPSDPEFPANHTRNREISSSKGCITTDQIAIDSALRTLYEAPEFRAFLCAVLDETELHEYADTLSSINIHYADEGQELGWHFDN